MKGSVADFWQAIATLQMTRRRKILWLTKGLGLGGAERLLIHSLPYLDRSSFDYEVCYLLPWKNALVDELEGAGIPVHCLNQRTHFDPRVVINLARLMRERSADLVHMHLPYAAIVGRMAAKLARVRATVYTEHSTPDRYHWLTSLAHNKTCSWNDAVICVADVVRAAVVNRYHPGASVKVLTIHNGVDWQGITSRCYDLKGVRHEFGIPDEHTIVAQIAGFRPVKRHEQLLRAVKLVLAEEPQTTFLLVGGGPLLGEMKQMAQTLGISEHIVFTGPRTDSLRLMAAAALVTLSSVSEALGLSILEAMALGLPVVGTSVGGIPEVVTNGVNGLLVEPENPASLAQGILVLCRSPELRKRLGSRANETVRQRFSADRMVARVEAVYDHVLASKRSA